MMLIPFVAGLIGLGVALWMARIHPPMPQPNPESPRPEGAVASAVELAGLRYLPADTNIAFAAQPGAILAYATRTNQDARELILKAGIPAKVLDSLTTLGLTLAQIDSLVGGTFVGDRAVEIRLTLVLTLRTPPTDEDDFLRRLKAKNQPGGKGHHDVEFAGFPFTLGRVSPTVWVFGFDSKKDMEAVERGGYVAGGRQLAGGLQDMLSQQVPADAAAWIATNNERWAEKPGVKLLLETETLLKKPEWLPTLAKGRAGMASLSFGDTPRIRLFVKASNAANGQQARNYFAERAATDAKIQHGGEGEAAFFEAPIDPATAFATLQKFLGDTTKK